MGNCVKGELEVFWLVYEEILKLKRMRDEIR